MKNVYIVILFSVLLNVSCDSQQNEQSTKTADLQVKEKVNVVESTKKAVKKIEQDMAANTAKVQASMPEAKVSMSGEQVYKQSCQTCHASGAAGAPKLGDETAWKPRIDKGMDSLYFSAQKGIPGTAMMPKGTCATCSDKELQAAVDFMVAKVK